MKTLECIIFDCEHGFCAFIKSPNNYGLLIDCGSRDSFSPIKWVRSHYNIQNGNIVFFETRGIAKAIISHLHMDHFDDVASFEGNKYKPKHLTRDTETLKYIEAKINQETDEERKKLLIAFNKFQSTYTQDPKIVPDWGFDYVEHRNLTLKAAEEVSQNDEKIINNRSYVTAVSFAEKKIIFPGDIEVEGWLKALGKDEFQSLVEDTTFFVASHHGHKSGFTEEILKHSGIPDVFIVSCKSNDESVDTSYSKEGNSKGHSFEGESGMRHMISTRDKGSIKITIYEDGNSSIASIDTPDNLNEEQKRILSRRKRKLISNWINK